MTEIILNMSERRYGILLGLVTSACMDAAREGRTGSWVDEVRGIAADIECAEHYAARKIHPTGGEPFGTRVTFWSEEWGIKRAVITRSPKPEAEREFLDSREWAIHIEGSGMTYVPAEMLTLGWHPEVVS